MRELYKREVDQAIERIRKVTPGPHESLRKILCERIETAVEVNDRLTLDLRRAAYRSLFRWIGAEYKKLVGILKL